MLLDEPFAGIDPISIADIRDLVKDLKRRGIGVLITDHNVRETLDIVDRAYIIYDGRVLFSGSPEELVADTNVRWLYLGEGFSLGVFGSALPSGRCRPATPPGHPAPVSYG